MAVKDEAEKTVLTPYDITGKQEIEVEVEVFSRLCGLLYDKNVSTDEKGLERTYEIVGKDTLFYVVASAFRVFCDKGANAAKLHIETEVHKLFVS